MSITGGSGYGGTTARRIMQNQDGPGKEHLNLVPKEQRDPLLEASAEAFAEEGVDAYWGRLGAKDKQD